MPKHEGFSSPWAVEETDGCFVVRDQDGHTLALVCCDDEPGRGPSGELLTRDEALRLAESVAKLPDLLCWPSADLPGPGIRN